MIASASDVMWICPHCRKTRSHRHIADKVATQCPGCRFAYPVSQNATGGSEIWSLESGQDEETWTERWGAIRADRYQIVRVLSSGAQGKILLAHHRHLNQRCVVKLVATQDETWVDIANQRLRNEAQAGIRVNHVNVARVLDCDCVDKAWYFVMEYVPGDNLRRILQHVQQLPWQQVVDIGRQTAAGLAAIHQNKLVHRDIKPSNLMLTHDGTVKIMDLGLVKVPIGPGALGVTHAGQVLGTPLFMPPEQFDAAESIDARADFYSLGVTLFQLLVGRPPFNGRAIDELADQHRLAPLVWPEELSADVPEWLREVIGVCLAKRPDQRFESAVALEEALHKGQTPSNRSKPADVRPSRGVAVMTFANLSRREEDDWIGDAIAEYVSSRLMEFEGVHVADRHVLANVIKQTSESAGANPDQSRILEAARLVGVSHVITGSYQVQDKDIRIIAHALARDESKATHLTTVSGPVATLFELEDRLTDTIIGEIGRELTKPLRRHESGGGTTNLEAHEKYILGRRAFASGAYKSAIEFAQEARNLDPDYQEAMSLLGAAYARLGEYDRAVSHHQRQEQIARDNDDHIQLAVALGNLGATYYYKGEYDVAYEFLERAAALSVSDKHPPTPDTAKLYGNLGMVYMRLDRPDDAERAFQQAIEICKQFNDLVAMVWPYNGMGSVLLKQGLWDKAGKYHHLALTLAEETGDRVMVGVSHMNLGRCACLDQSQSRISEAEICFNAALGTLETTDFWNGLALVHEHMAEMYLRHDRPKDALPCVDKRIELAKRHGNKRIELEAWKQKAEAYEMLNCLTDQVDALKKCLDIEQRPSPYESLHRYLQGVTTRQSAR